jgi:dimethylglycine dehydrogenase
MGCGAFDIGLHRCKVGRLSVSGELGYEIHCNAMDHAGLRRALLEAGAEFGIREYGFNALLSLRLEKSFGIWSAEFTQGYTAAQTGMDRWIDWSKDFIGKDAALRERDTPPAQVIAMLEVADGDSDASGYEPIWQNGTRVGFITSGGYGHTVGKSLALAMLDRDAATPGTELMVHIVGAERAATVIPTSPYDPDGKAMRA